MQPLAQALEDTTRPIYQRVNAANALGKIEDARVVPPLVTALRDGEEQVRVAAASALGDLTWNIEKDLVCPNDKVGPVDLLVVSHHGSNFSSSPALLAALRPRIAVLDNGARKGGDLETYETVAHSPNLKRLWQLHFGEKAGTAHNVSETYIANPTAENDAHASIEVAISKQGSITVTNDRNGVAENYSPVAVGAAASK